MDAWTLTETSFNAKQNLACEGLFTQGSGYLQVRGSLEERLEGSPQNREFMRVPGNVTIQQFDETDAKWGTFLPGVYGRHPLLNNEMVNLPYFFGLELECDGERFDPTQSAFSEWQRSLSLRNGLLTRSFCWTTTSGRQIRVRFRRFISAAHKHLAVQEMQVDCDHDSELTIRARLDADVRTSGYDHLAEVHCAAEGREARITVTTDRDETVSFRSRLSALDWSHAVSERSVVHIARTTGRECRLEKRTLVTSSRDPEAVDFPELSFDELLAEHDAVWSRRWAESDVVIEGDDESQLALRCSIYHLLRSHVPDDPRVAIDAKGFAGDAYYGRFFWDTEMYMMPFFLYTTPEKAKTLMDFRLQSLPGAEANAAEYGCNGARYAWESDADGAENCPSLVWQYRDHEVHVTADVVYGLLHYAKASGNEEYLRDEARACILQTARFWMDRIDRVNDSPQLLGVMGPDEYCPLTDNNAYTNRLARLNLELAASLGGDEEECRAWRETAASLPTPRRDDGLILQDEGWDRLAEPQFDRFWTDRSKPFGAQVSQDRLYRSKASKQADVLMLMWLFAGEFSEAEVRRAWKVYEPYCTHDSSLSAGIHALMALRIGEQERAWEFWRQTAFLDIDGKAGQGIHIACAAAAWMIAVFGFGGVRTAMESDELTVKPQLPKQWQRLSFPLIWKGRRHRITVTAEGLEIDDCE